MAVNVVGLAATLFSVDYMERYTSKFRYYSLFLFMVAGMNGVVLAGDLFNLYVFMEIAAIASYALVAFGCEHEELEASFKYAVLGSLASAFILVGVALTYGLTGTLNMAHVAQRLPLAGGGRLAVLALALFVCGFGLKAALVPFHAWLPDAHPSAPAPVSAMLSGVVIKALGIYVLARLVFNVFGATAGALAVFRLLGLVSMVVGVLLAIGQWDMKRLFAYHSISQIGYVVIGLGLGTPLGHRGRPVPPAQPLACSSRCSSSTPAPSSTRRVRGTSSGSAGSTGGCPSPPRPRSWPRCPSPGSRRSTGSGASC